MKKCQLLEPYLWARDQGKGVARLQAKRKPGSQGKEAARVRTKRKLGSQDKEVARLRAKRKPATQITYSRERNKV
jgi:hypothetical protein